MRPVNLIPADERRTSGGPVRTGPIAYLLVGALLLGLGAMVMLVLSKNTIADHKAEIASLKQQEAAVSARAQQYAPFTNFSSLEQSRNQTVSSLADSRFDWERVMRELSRVIPSNVWLDHLSGSATGGEGGSGSTISDPSITGPALQISGCATGQDAVAGFLAALRDIDGVTRVGLTSSARPGGDASSGASTGDSSGSGGCATRDFIAAFQITVAFDHAPTPATSGTSPTAPATTPPATTTPASTSTTPSTTTTPAPTTPAPAPSDSGTPAAATTP